MARTKNQEVIRRVGVASRQSNAPDRVVNADLDSSRGFQGMTSTAIAVLGKINDAVAARGVRKFKEDEADGEAARSTGAEVSDLSTMSKGFQRGYKKADGIVAINDLQNSMRVDMRKLEPDANIDELISTKTAELMSNPAFADPEVKRALAPAIARASEQVRAEWAGVSLEETFTRQRESLTVVAQEGMKDGSLRTPEGLARFYENLNSEEFAFLDHRDVNEIYADAASNVIASGDLSPEDAQAIAEQKLPGTDINILATKKGDEVRRALAAGETVRAKRLEEAQKQAQADAEFTLQDLADKGRMTDAAIQTASDRLGLTGSDELQFKRYWSNQQEATIRRWESEAKEREREARQRAALTMGNPYANTTAQNNKAIAAEWEAAGGDTAKQGAILNKYGRMGLMVPQVKAILDRASAGDAAVFQKAARLWDNLQANPAVKAAYANTSGAAQLSMYSRAVKDMSLSPQEALEYVRRPKVEQKEANDAVTKAWNDKSAGPSLGSTIADLGDGNVRSRHELVGILADAKRIQATNLNLDPQDAIRAAVERADAQRTTVRGVRVKNEGMPRGAEGATEALIDEVEKKLPGMEGLYAAPNPLNPEQWIVMDRTGQAVPDPDTGAVIGFSPRLIADQFSQWTTRHANSQTQKASAFRSAYRGRNVTEPDYDTAMAELPKKIAEAKVNRNKPGYAPHILDKKIVAMEERYASLKAASAEIDNVPSDFISFLNNQ